MDYRTTGEQSRPNARLITSLPSLPQTPSRWRDDPRTGRQSTLRRSKRIFARNDELSRKSVIAKRPRSPLRSPLVSQLLHISHRPHPPRRRSRDQPSYHLLSARPSLNQIQKPTFSQTAQTPPSRPTILPSQNRRNGSPTRPSSRTSVTRATTFVLPTSNNTPPTSADKPTCPL